MATVLADGRAAWERSGHLFVVADGMGAHAAGELASRLAVDLIPHHYAKQHQPRPIENLHRALIEANNEIYRRGQANIEFRNMGTTASALAILPEGAICAHVGDSRIYHLRNNQLEQITFDHSLVWEMQASGGVAEESVRSGMIPKNVITRSLGPNASVLIDLEGPIPVRKGDKFLLCSDGLSGQLNDEEIGVFMRILPTQTAAQLMIDLANLRGGPDNITLVIVEVVGEGVVTSSQVSLKIPRLPVNESSFKVGFAVVAAICLLASAIFMLVQQQVAALVAAIAGVISLIVGWIIYQAQHMQKEDKGERYGRAPYRRYVCNADAALVDRLAGTIQALKEATVENNWTKAGETLERLRKKGEDAAKERNFTAAVEHYSCTIVETMRLIRDTKQ